MWTEVLAYVCEKVPKQVYETWFTPIELDRIENHTAYLAVPNKFFGDWLNEHYRELLAEAVSALQGGEHFDVSFVINNRKTAASIQQESATSDTGGRGFAASRSKRGVQLNPKYTFKNFVVGAGNQFAHAACMAVAEQPAKAYNPLFLYGGVGLGKTHLLNAIGNHLAEGSDLRIAYLTTEQFTNEVINSIRYDKMVDLRKRYRNVDMLMIDDIQFLAGKERTQEEFFHTFNTLYEARKQIVLSSDRFPKDMPDIEERLRSRFEWGLIADLQPPDVETRIAILRKKSEDERIALPEDVIHGLRHQWCLGQPGRHKGILRLFSHLSCHAVEHREYPVICFLQLPDHTPVCLSFAQDLVDPTFFRGDCYIVNDGPQTTLSSLKYSL